MTMTPLQISESIQNSEGGPVDPLERAAISLNIRRFIVSSDRSCQAQDICDAKMTRLTTELVAAKKQIFALERLIQIQ